MMKRLTTIFTCAALAATMIVSTAQAAPIFVDLDVDSPRNLNDFVIGNEFTVGNFDVEIDALGVWDQADDGLMSAHEVGLWDSSENLVVQAEVPAGTAGELEDSFRYVPLQTNVTLLANETYRIAALYQTGSGDAFNEGFIRNVQEIPVIEPGFGIASFDGDYFLGSATLVRPTTDDSFAINGRWGAANARAIIPEPAAMVLFSLGGLSVLIYRRRVDW